MGENFKFSIIIAVYNVEEYLNETIDSIINQSLDFKSNVQLILVDDGSSDNSLEIAFSYQEQFPNNILVLTKENGGQASARNLGLKHAKGKYVNFLDSDDYFSETVLKDVYSFFEKFQSEIDVVSIPMFLFERIEGPHRLNYKFNKSRIINLITQPNNPILSASSSFIKFDAIKNYQFDVNLVNLEDALVINKILLNKKKYGVINSCEYYYRQRNTRNSTVDGVTSKKEYFTCRLVNFYKNIIEYSISLEGEVPYFIQYLMAYDLQWLLKIPNLDIFDDEDEINEFWKNLNYVLSFIDINVIYGNKNISKDIKPFFLYLLNEKRLLLQDDDDSLFLNIGRITVDKLNRHKIWLDIVEIRNDILNISGIFLTNFPTKFISINVIKENNNEAYSCSFVKYNSEGRKIGQFLGIDWKYPYNFDVSLPLSKNESTSLKFTVYYNDGINSSSFDALLDLNHNVKLSNFSACISNKPFIILFKNNKLHILQYNYFSMLRYEYSNIKKTIKDRPNFFLNSIFIRLIYYILFPFMSNKKIWIFSDRSDFADDNAKHLFQYTLNLEDSIKKYFVVNKDSISYEVMKKYNKNVIPFSGLRHKILYLFSEMIISSYVNEEFFNPFFNSNMELYKGLNIAKRVFLQHGVTKDDISKFICKYNHNLSLITTVSDFEKNSFMQEGYNFEDEIIQTLGFPRYDRLLSEGYKKQILFMPTWRLQLTSDTLFINSEYYDNLNSFLNNEDLLKLINDNGYKLIFKPHAELMKYLDLLNISDKVQISLNESYNDLFNESAILITDYSSVFFDFSYLKKPIIYYQPTDDYHYNEGYFEYATMGFGDVITDEDDLVKKIEYYFNNNCKMEDKYKQNVDIFFKFNDDKNCERVYNWLLKL